MNRTQRGFTLIELLVVMTIIALLATALLAGIPLVLDMSNKTADSQNLKWHYMALRAYKQKFGHYPTQDGHKFVLAPWVEGVVSRTYANRDRYFSPTQSQDPRWIELQEQEPDEIWRSFDAVTSEDTSYAGRARQHNRTVGDKNQAMVASDNEHGNHYEDGTILVLLSDGDVRSLLRERELKKTWPEGQDDFHYKVGAESPHPMLRKLAK
ncbi:MAG: type II secretion system protein [Planctomycetota bacterium]|jgi:prepilin-type N-terminal cleavage/methylation domain-containing protein